MILGRVASVTVVPSNGPAIVINPVAAQGLGGPAQLRVYFEVERGVSGTEPARATIKIWNARPASRKIIMRSARRVWESTPRFPSTPTGLGPAGELASRLGQVTLLGGYIGRAAILFSGSIVSATDVREGPDWVTTLECQDMAAALARSAANVGWPRGTPVLAIIQMIAFWMGLPIAYATPTLQGVFANGYIASGRCRDDLDLLVTSAELQWYVDGGKLFIADPKLPVPGPSIEVTEAQAPGAFQLLQRAQPAENGRVELAAMLAPSAAPGRLCNVFARDYSGPVKIEAMKHVGDMAASEWRTEIRGVPVAA